MAIDTQAKRFSMQALLRPWRGVKVVPSGTVTAAERAAFIFLYGGIALTAITRADDRTVMGRVIIALVLETNTLRVRTQQTSGSDDLQTVSGGSAITVEVIA